MKGREKMLQAGGDMDTQRMSNAPVYYAMVQIKFAPIAAMKKYVGEIQDMLRVDGYPIFEAAESTQLKFEVKGPDEPPTHQITTSTHWLIFNEDRTAGFVLGEDYLTFQTTDYITRNEFIPEILKGFKAVCDVAKVSFVSRIGLRYLDAVLPFEGEDLSDYFNDGLRNVDLGMKAIQSVNEMVFQTVTSPLAKEGIIVVRVFRSMSKLGFPPGVEVGSLVVSPQFREAPEMWHAVIDTDHYVEAKMPIDLVGIDKQIRALHSELHESFKKVVSPYALDKWK